MVVKYSCPMTVIILLQFMSSLAQHSVSLPTDYILFCNIGHWQTVNFVALHWLLCGDEYLCNYFKILWKGSICTGVTSQMPTIYLYNMQIYLSQQQKKYNQSQLRLSECAPVKQDLKLVAVNLALEKYISEDYMHRYLKANCFSKGNHSACLCYQSELFG